MSKKEQLFLGVEIGGTKLQLGVGTGKSSKLIELVRENVDVAAGAEGIVRLIEEQGRAVCARHAVQRVGIGFGGPVDVRTGIVTKSHQIEGWSDFAIGDRLSKTLGKPVRIDNDCNVAALGEANLGAGQGRGRVFYLTVGSGIGGGFVVDGRLDGNMRPAISEIGHLRPGVASRSAEETVEHVSSGWGIANAAQRILMDDKTTDNKETLLAVCDQNIELLTTEQIGSAAIQGDLLACRVIERSTETLGWAIAQVITLLAPEIVIIGGGVSLIGDLFFSLLESHVATFVFPPLAGSYELRPAALGEEVVVHGAIQYASQQD